MPMMGLGLAGARHRSGAESEGGNERCSDLGLHGVFLPCSFVGAVIGRDADWSQRGASRFKDNSLVPEGILFRRSRAPAGEPALPRPQSTMRSGSIASCSHLIDSGA